MIFLLRSESDQFHLPSQQSSKYHKFKHTVTTSLAILPLELSSIINLIDCGFVLVWFMFESHGWLRYFTNWQSTKVSSHFSCKDKNKHVKSMVPNRLLFSYDDGCCVNREVDCCFYERTSSSSNSVKCLQQFKLPPFNFVMRQLVMYYFNKDLVVLSSAV